MLRAAGKSVKKHDVGTQALMGVIDGASKVTGQLAGAAERVTDYSKSEAEKATPPEKDDNSWSGVAKRTWRVLTDGKYAKERNLAVSRNLHKEAAPVVNKINTEAKKIRQDAEHHSGVIRTKLGTTGKAVSKATEILPELLTAGSSTRAKIANNAIGAAKDYGENKSIPGALAKFVVPGNSKIANVASETLSEKLAAARKQP